MKKKERKKDGYHVWDSWNFCCEYHGIYCFTSSCEDHGIFAMHCEVCFIAIGTRNLNIDDAYCIS